MKNYGDTKERKPIVLGDLERKPVEDTAAGLPAIWASMRNTWGKMGVVDGTRTLLKLNQKGGIDCQSCAWADPEDRTIAEFCESGAKALADEGQKKLVTPEFFARYSVEELSDKDDHWLNLQGRISQPFVLRENATHYEPISWQDAFQLLAEELNSLASPDEAIFYTSGRTSNETAFLYQLFVRQFGTNNMPDCSNMCHESTSVGLAESTGVGKANVRLKDFEDTDLIIIMGQNPGTNAPRMMSSLQDAKQNGAKIIAINPLPEAGLMNFINPNPQHYHNPLKFPLALLGGDSTKFADLFLPVKIGGDMALLKGIMKILVEKENENPNSVFDHKFIEEKTIGFNKFIKNLETISWEDILNESGISREQINEAAKMFNEADRVITCWAMGITQHKESVATIQDIANLHFLRGQVGKDGAGLCPVRGHSNVQGDRTMGIWHKMNDDFREKLEKVFEFQTPEKDGFDVVESCKAMNDGRGKVFFAMGGNFLSATSDTNFTAEGLRKTNLIAQVITKLNRTALATGRKSLILPCIGRSEIDTQESGEQFVSCESTTLQVQMSKGILEPKTEHHRSETWIVGELAKAVLGERSTLNWDKMVGNYDNIREAIGKVVSGHENYNERIREPGGFFLPNPPREGKFPTESGKAVFVASKLEKIAIESDQLLLTTLRAHDQFNTTIYDYKDRYRGIYGTRRVILMNEQDIADRNLKEGDVVDITSYFTDGKRHAETFIVVTYPIPKQCAAVYFPEGNPLVPIDSVAKRSNCPTSKLVVISVEKSI
ncbi:MAG: FdhF/YdeP family oxidoreductase [Acidobacteriota bacterium]|nr:FdhF/YdeP family oxidoreductase [Acidobacteriota bacterium]